MPADVFNRPADRCQDSSILRQRRYSSAGPLYLRRIGGDWLAMAMEESVRRAADAHSPGYDPQSPTKKLGPWGSGTEKRAVTLDEMLEELEEQRMEGP
jgi:hypothetical protein